MSIKFVLVIAITVVDQTNFFESKSELTNEFSDEGMSVQNPSRSKLDFQVVVDIPESLDSSSNAWTRNGHI